MADSRKKEFRKCGVCGDHALGSNFNAITCESCKAFFRRNALKTKDFKCPFNNNCNVDVVTRRFCQKCRLRKCLDIGMKKEWIMTEDEKKAKREKIEKNRQKRGNQEHHQQTSVVIQQEFTYIKVESPDQTLNQGLLSPASSMSPMTPQTPGSVSHVAELAKNRLFAHQPLTPSDCEYSPPSKVIIHSDCGADTGQDSVLLSECELSRTSATFADEDSETISSQPEADDLIYVNNLEENIDGTIAAAGDADSLLTSCNNSQQTCPDLIKSKKLLESVSVASQTCTALEFTSLPGSVYEKAIAIEFLELPIRNPKGNPKELSVMEKAKLRELVTANEVLKMPLVCGVTDPSLLDVINMTDHAIRRLIKMSKKINSFKNLCQTDQIALLKGGCTELMILRSVMSYDPEKDCWQGPQGPKIMSIKVDILKEAKGNVYEEHKRFINSFHPNWRTDENIMLILSGIALFTPERPNTVHREVIKLEQDTYYYLLRRYLETIYSWCEAKATYLRLIHKVQELHILNENHVRVYLDVNPKDVEPLLIEIFDLKY